MKSAPTLGEIVRYPVKGLPGVPVRRARLTPGRGLRFDRSMAVENGLLRPRNRSGWNPRETYFHLAADAGLARFAVHLHEPDPELDGRPGTEFEHEPENAKLVLVAPDGRSVAVRLDQTRFGPDAESAAALLRDCLPGGPLGGPRLTRTTLGLWDWPQAHLSIINLATVRALEAAAGQTIDPRRFRANLMIDGLPAWSELDLVGQRIRIGALLEVFQPTGRCRATTVNPDTARHDLHLPGLLARRFGHLFCGVYARVVEGGVITSGQPIEIRPRQAAPDFVPEFVPDPGWPRTVELVRTRIESDSVTSFWLRDPVAAAAVATHPGRHLRIHLPTGEGPGWRCYTASATDGGLVRISVKRDGRISQLLHESRTAGDALVVSGPFGEVTLDPAGTGDVLMVSAGIGITPTVAMLRALVAAGSQRRIRVVHVDRRPGQVPLWDEVAAACAALPDTRAELFLTQPLGDRAIGRADAGLTTRAGRPQTGDLDRVLAELDLGSTLAYVCGPGTFGGDVRDILTGLGLPAAAIRAEVFFSPSSAALTIARDPSSAGPHRVTIGAVGAEWRAESGAVLDAVEQAGIEWPSECRVGACGRCVAKLRTGTFEYLTDPALPPAAGSLLLCCSAPTSDLCLEATDRSPR